MKIKGCLFALAALALADCTGDVPADIIVSGNAQPDAVAIEFSAASNRTHTRADLVGAAAAGALGNHFHVFGVKTVDGNTRNVYPDYVVEYNGNDGAGEAGSTASNSSGWEYVGLNNYPNQTIHYWDYSASNFTFQAWSASTGNATVDVTGNNTLTVTTTSASDLAKLYVADLVSIDRAAHNAANHYGGIVTFTFRSMSARVRLGIYESISGYSVSQVTFRSAKGLFANSNTNALLEGSFNAQDGSDGGTFNVTYNAVTGKAEFNNTAVGTPADFCNFGPFSQQNIGTDRSNPTWAGGTSSYQLMLPNEDHAGDMTLYIDFTMTADDGSDDVLRVTGAHVTVPADQMVWHPNYAYTYLFRITKDINGTTGEEGQDPEKLYPITFDAIVNEFVETPSAGEFEVSE